MEHTDCLSEQQAWPRIYQELEQGMLDKLSDCDSSLLRLYLGDAYRNGDWQNVLLFSGEQVRRDPDEFFGWFHLATALECLGRLAEARGVYVDEIIRIEINTGRSTAISEKAILRLQAEIKKRSSFARWPDHFRELKVNYMDSLDVAKMSTLVRYSLQAEEERDYISLNIFLNEILRRSPKNIRALIVKASMLRRLKKFGEALEILERVIVVQEEIGQATDITHQNILNIKREIAYRTPSEPVRAAVRRDLGLCLQSSPTRK